MTSRVCAYTAVCERDAELWSDKYLAEVNRLSLPFVVHFDDCRTPTERKYASDPLCRGFTRRPAGESFFTDLHKGLALELLKGKRQYRWALNLDSDETFDRDAPAKFGDILSPAVGGRFDAVRCHWVNVWDRPDQVRLDWPSNPVRDKFHNLTRHDWRHVSPVLAGPKVYSRLSRVEPDVRVGYSDLVVLHWGLMTRELRESHKKFWDDNFRRAVGGNPYGAWDYALDEVNHPPQLAPNAWL